MTFSRGFLLTLRKRGNIGNSVTSTTKDLVESHLNAISIEFPGVAAIVYLSIIKSKLEIVHPVLKQ